MRLRATLLLPLLLTASATAAPPPAASKVDAQLLADVTTIKPGDAFTLAVTLATQPDWHIYWLNPGDAGTPTRFTLKLPDGFKVDPPSFPLPHQFIQPGNLTAYGYTGQATFLIRITTPANLAAPTAPITVNAAWLCCNDQLCVPGKQSLTLNLPVATTTTPANQKLFEEARKQIPASSPPADLVAISAPAANLSTTASPLTFQLTWKQKVQDVACFPLTVDGLDLSNLTVNHQDMQTKLTASARILAGQHLAADHQDFLVAYTDTAGTRHGFFTGVPLAAPANSK